MKNDSEIIDSDETQKLYTDIKILINQSKNKIFKTVNTEMINLYWNIGKLIIDIQERNPRAKYGDFLIENISFKLAKDYGKGFSARNIKRMRKLYLCYPKRTTMLSQLT